MAQQKNITLFTDPCLTYPDHDLGLSFDAYRVACQSLITAYRPDLKTTDHPEVILEANSPFELKPEGYTKYGALLIHGLYDCPFVMRDIGNELFAQGLLVRSVLLPGHGTVPGALLNVTYSDWLQTLRYGIANLARDVEKIFLVGFSTGASLALYHLLQGDTANIAGAILLAPAIKISPLAIIANLPPLFGQAWLQQDEEVDYAKYRSFTYNSAYQVYLLAEKIQELSQKRQIACPLLIAISYADKTVDSAATLKFFQRKASAKSQLLLYTRHQENFNDPRISMRSSLRSDLHISDISHIAIPIAPDNSHYGKNGDYIYASHATGEGEKNWYGAYAPWEYKIFQALYQLGLTKYQRWRLSYNPEFDFIQQAVSTFLRKNRLNN